MAPMSPRTRRSRHGAWRWRSGLALVLAALLAPGAARSVAQSGARSGIVQRTRAAVAARDLRGAEQIAVRALRQSPSDAEALLALSWVGRGALAAKQLDMALRVARDTETRIRAVLQLRPLDAEPQLPLALGAAYEVQAQALAGLGGRSEALLLLNRAIVRFARTSIQARLQKNVHLLSLKGQPMPPIATEEYLTGVRLTPGATRGKPMLLFFWAHWCSDCKGFVRTLSTLQAEFGPKGLAVVAPTQRYGYIGARDNVPAAEERRHIGVIRQKFYPSLAPVPIPLSPRNFSGYGVSTTPTLVLVDRKGLVQLYHPGAMTEAELRPVLSALVKP
ncbi:MAG: TlpA disulfide reductase family protein [Vicinamibacterales bacterium]|nr:TlpA disulfide reductase family protein [Vicinamibacterales bacterium]